MIQPIGQKKANVCAAKRPVVPPDAGTLFSFQNLLIHLISFDAHSNIVRYTKIALKTGDDSLGGIPLNIFPRAAANL